MRSGSRSPRYVVAEIALGERDDVAVRIAAAQRVGDVVQRIDAEAQVRLAQLERHRIQAHRREKEMTALAAVVRDLERRTPGQLVGGRDAPALDVRHVALGDTALAATLMPSR